MAWFEKLLGKAETATPEPPAAAPAASATDTKAAVPPKAAGKKLKLNFKRMPKQVVEAIAAETTGQQQRTPAGKRKGGLSGAFNQAAGMFGADTDDDDLDGQGGNSGQGFAPQNPPSKPGRVTIKLPAPQPYFSTIGDKY